MSATTNPALASFDRAPAARPWRFVAFRTCTVTVFGAGTTVTGAGEQDVEDLADEASELTRWITRHHTMAVSSASMRRNTRPATVVAQCWDEPAPRCRLQGLFGRHTGRCRAVVAWPGVGERNSRRLGRRAGVPLPPLVTPTV